jgi:GcrA cell cycle regulator
MDWSIETIATLRRCWSDGMSASKIAEALGGISRNAVIGKAHRLKLPPRPSPIKREARRARTATAGRACMWPVGDPKSPDFHFCGEALTSSKPYCDAHCALAYHKRSVDAA